MEKNTFSFELTVRSIGPDGLPKNHDDITVTRRKPHGETTLTKEAAKSAEEIAAGAAKGIKKGLGFGGDKKK